MSYRLAQNKDVEIVDLDFVKQYLQVDYDEEDVL